MKIELTVYESLDSTNLALKALAEQGGKEGLAVRARQQTAGRGRLARKWVSPKDGGVWLSVLLRPQIPMERIQSITMMAALAVSDTLCELGVRPQIKWPNDVLARGKKICGILLEMGARGSGIDYIVLGIGLNSNLAREAFPPDIRDRMTSTLEECGRAMDNQALAWRLLEAVDRRYPFVYDRPDQLRRDYLALCCTMGMRVEVRGGVTASGVAQGLDERGFLLLRTETGELLRISAGDVTLQKECSGHG